MCQSKNYSREQKAGGSPGCQDSEQDNDLGGMKSVMREDKHFASWE